MGVIKSICAIFGHKHVFSEHGSIRTCIDCGETKFKVFVPIQRLSAWDRMIYNPVSGMTKYE